MPPTNRPTQGDATLSLAELAAVLGAALGAGYDGVRSGRVRNLPDARTIRWYQTLGIVDRPAAFQGRTALYARRHVLQLAAIKKLQAAGFSLADVQRGLAGKTDAELARAAGLTLADLDRRLAAAGAARVAANDAKLHAALVAQPAQGRAAGKFWSVRPTAATPPASAPAAEETPVEAAPAGAALQSTNIGASVALVWAGRPLTAAEREAVARLAAPVVEFLSSSAAKAVAERAGRGRQSSARPQGKKGRARS